MDTKSIVMSRVRTAHALRPLVSATALSLVVFVLALYGIGREVWVAHVFENLSNALGNGTITTYLTAAFLNTRFVVQALSIVSLGALIWLARETAHAIGHTTLVRA
ncbi:MAG: hypothetical protein ABA06_02355 [Parcubacteria bacterium C7867-001]|nr:MAG: hypothetical protein ABA06_02355 [Parcubacteria bacterium C7867-001]